MSECLLAERRPVPYPEPRPPIAPLWEGPMIPCMSPWPPGIAVDGPTAWLRRTWIASSSLSKRSSIRLCCWLINDVKFDFVWDACIGYISKTWVGTNHTLEFWIYSYNKVYFLKTIIKINSDLPRKLMKNAVVIIIVFFMNKGNSVILPGYNKYVLYHIALAWKNSDYFRKEKYLLNFRSILAGIS